MFKFLMLYMLKPPLPVTWDSLGLQGAAVGERLMGVVQGIEGREMEELRKRAGWKGKTR